jgi:ABC-type amino acid transport substrate-binding protein
MEFPVRKTLLALACLLALLALPATAATLRLAVPDLPPYGEPGPDGGAGLFAGLGRAVIAEAGFEPEVVVLDPEKIVPAMAAGKVEAAVLFPGPAIGIRAENLGELLAVDVVAVGRAGTVLRIRRDLAGKRVAVVSNCECDGGLSRRDGATPLPASDFDRALKLLLAGQVGAAVGPWPAILAAVDRSGRTRRILGDPLTLSRTGAHLFLSSEAATPENRKKLQDALTRLRENGTLHKIITNHAL